MADRRTSASRAVTRVLLLVAALVLSYATPALAQDLPSASVRPADTDNRSPADGNWFVIELGNDLTGEATALVTNVADVPQQVRFYVTDVKFDNDGDPQVVEGPEAKFPSWTRLEVQQTTLGPQEETRVPFTVLVPRDAEPGDHVGYFFAETRGLQGNIDVVKRVAQRIYVTVPGDARRSFAIQTIETTPDNVLWPGSMQTSVLLRNDGRVRLTPSVTVRNQTASGARYLLSQSVEPYVLDVSVPWYGGPQRLTVQATTDGGLVRTATKTVWLIPWGLIVLVVVAASAVYSIRRWWKNRKSATAELKQDIQRLEQLITQQAKAQESTAAVGTGLPAADDVSGDEEAVLLAALKRARRSDDDTALARIALAKHMISGDALDLVLEALEEHRGKHREALLDAAVSYGADALSTHERFSRLPDDLQAELGERLVTAGETVSGKGNGTPAKVPKPVVGQSDSDALRTELAKIKGVGPAKQEALVSRFGSLDAFRGADVETLTDVPGIGYATAREILDELDG